MYKNYLVSSINNLLKNKLFSFINIAGLAIGLAACMLIALFVQQENSYDKHWTNSEQLYRLNTGMSTTGDDLQMTGYSAMLAMPAFKAFFSDQIEYGSRLRSPDLDIYVGDTRFYNRIPFVDADIAHMFDFNVLAGDLAASLESPGNIALSAELAERIFGSTDVLGKVLSIVDQGEERVNDYQVAAVYELPEGKSVLDLPALVRLDESKLDPFTFSNWVTLDFVSLVQLAPGAALEQIEADMLSFINSNVDISRLNPGPGVAPGDRVAFALQPLSAVYLDAAVRDNIAGGNSSVVMAFALIATLVLLVACINFTILSTASATQRAKEVAMRKTIGANKVQLFAQFLGESFLTVLPGILVAMVLVELFLPLFEALIGRSLEVHYGAPATLLSLLALFLIVGFAGGFYPAVVLSHFRPLETLKANKSAEGRTAFNLRNTLVAFQFTISIALIIATATIYLQVRYSANRDPGFNSENLLVIDDLNRRADVSALKATLKQQIVALPNVESASLSGYQPTQTSGYSTYSSAFTLDGSESGEFRIASTAVDEDFFRTFQIAFVAGRDFDSGRDQNSPVFDTSWREPSSQSNIVINVSAARRLGFQDPQRALGARISSRGFNPAVHSFTVIGVVEDSQFLSLRRAKREEVYLLSPRHFTDVLTLRYQGSASDIRARVGEIWEAVMGDALLTTSFVEDDLAGEFSQERTEARILFTFSLLAIFIACMGLYGSAAFTVGRRTREIGIRKVLGAEVRELVSLLLWQFSRPVLMANVFAWPVSLWAMLGWLQRFPYQIDALLLVPLCIFAGLMALGIAWLVVVGNTFRLASTKPVLALRYE